MLPLRLKTSVSAMQREEPATTDRFLAVQFYESWSRSAAVRVGRLATQTRHSTPEIDAREAVTR